MKVLIIEDDFSLAELIKEKVEELGFENAIVHTGADAIKFLSNHTDYVVILDYSLTDMTGKEYISHLKSVADPTPPFIVATGHGDEHIAVDMMKLGARDYLIKNIHFLDKLPEVLKRMENELENEKMLNQAEVALKESEVKHISMISNISDVIGIIGVDGLIKYKSPNIEKLFGWKDDELIGLEAWVTVHPDDLERIKKVFNDLLKKDNSSTKVEYQYRCKDGSFKQIILTATNLKNNHVISGILINYHDITERKQTEENLIASEEKFRKAFMISPDAINITRIADGLYISISNGFTQITGYTAEEIVGKTSLEKNIWVNVEDRNRMVNDIKTKGYCKNLEAQFRKQDGIIFIGLMSASTIELNGENHILSITRDITERKLAEEALKKSEQQYRNFFEHDISGDYLSTTEGKLIDCNPAFAKILGYNSVEEALSINTDLLYPDPNFRNEFLDNLKKNKFLVDYEFSLLRKDGVLRNCVENVYGIFDDSDKLVQFQGYIYDITERKEAEELLRLNAEQFKVLTETSIDGFWRVDLSAKIIEVNNVFCEMTSYTKEELLKLSISDLDANENDEDAQNHVNKVAQFGYDRFDSKLKCKDGKIVDVEVSTTFSANLKTVSAFFKDITQRKKAEKELMEQMEEINRFNKLMVGREEKMIELKKEINELLVKNGINPKYKIVE